MKAIMTDHEKEMARLCAMTVPRSPYEVEVMLKAAVEAILADPPKNRIPLSKQHPPLTQ